MTKTDFGKELRHLYHPSAGEFSVVDVPSMNFVMVDGHGDPNTAVAYSQAVEALYAVSYGMKFISKRELERDYVIPPLEGLWWADDHRVFTDMRDKSRWDWTMMIMVPDFVSPELFPEAKDKAVRKLGSPPATLRLERFHEGLSVQIYERAVREAAGKKDLPALASMRMERLDEGRSVQILHRGSYDDEGPVLARLHNEWIPENGYVENGRHHEIYLSDPRRTAPSRLRTVLRQPIRKT